MKQLKWIKELYLMCVIICFMENNKFMILNKELESIKINKDNLFSNVFRIRLVDLNDILKSLYILNHLNNYNSNLK